MFVYVGTETSAAGWIASYAQRHGAPAIGFGTMTPSFFWAGLLIGRAVAPAALTQVSEPDSGFDQPVHGGRRPGHHPGGKQPDHRFVWCWSNWLGTGRRLSYHTCDLHPAVRETGVATHWIRLCGRWPGRSADSLAGRIDFGPVWGFTHRTSHSAVLRGIYDCLANFYYPGVGSGAFAKSLIVADCDVCGGRFCRKMPWDRCCSTKRQVTAAYPYTCAWLSLIQETMIADWALSDLRKPALRRNRLRDAAAQ